MAATSHNMRRRATPIEKSGSSQNQAKRRMVLRMRLSNLQKLALSRAMDPSFDWFNFGYCCGSILREFEPRRYRVRRPSGVFGWDNWPACSPETVLTLGKHRLETSLDNVPSHILAAVEKGLRNSAAEHRAFGPESIGRMMGITEAIRRDLKIWNLSAIDAPPSKAKADARRKAKRLAKERARRKRGSISRQEYLDRSLTKLRPWVELGISRRTWERRRKSGAIKTAVASAHGVSQVRVSQVGAAGAESDKITGGINLSANRPTKLRFDAVISIQWGQTHSATPIPPWERFRSETGSRNRTPRLPFAVMTGRLGTPSLTRMGGFR